MSARGDMKKLLRAAEAAGATLERGRKHVKVSVNGEVVAVVGTNGARGRNGDLLASARALRQAGIRV